MASDYLSKVKKNRTMVLARKWNLLSSTNCLVELSEISLCFFALCKCLLDMVSTAITMMHVLMINASASTTNPATEPALPMLLMDSVSMGGDIEGYMDEGVEEYTVVAVGSGAVDLSGGGSVSGFIGAESVVGGSMGSVGGSMGISVVGGSVWSMG